MLEPAVMGTQRVVFSRYRMSRGPTEESTPEERARVAALARELGARVVAERLGWTVRRVREIVRRDAADKAPAAPIDGGSR